MSLLINPVNVTAVLLQDGWHAVVKGTFFLDSYEYVDEDDFVYHGGGDSGVCATGFECCVMPDGDVISGPLTAVLAVRRDPSP